MAIRRHLIKPPFRAYVDWSHPLAQYLRGYWLFNEGAGLSAVNLAGGGHDIAFGGTTLPTWQTTQYGTGVDLTGVATNTTLTGVAGTLIDNLNPLTWEAFVFIRAASTYAARVLTKGGDSTSTYNTLMIGASYNIILTHSRATTYLDYESVDNVFTANSFNHIIATLDKTTETVKLYINGVEPSLALTTIGSGTFWDDSVRGLCFGNRPAGDRTLNGTLIYARYWNMYCAPDIARQLYDAPHALLRAATVRRFFDLGGGETPISASDSATLTDAATTLAAEPASTDSATLSEQSSIVASPATSDAASVSDATTTLVASVSATDTASESEASLIAASLTTTDSASVSDSSASVAGVEAADTVALTEAIGLTPSGQTDEATLSEATSLTVDLSASDSGNLAESSSINTGANPSATDLATLDESPSIAATLATADTAELSEAVDLLIDFAGADSGSLQDTSQIASTSDSSDAAALDEQSALDVANEAADAFLMNQEGILSVTLGGSDEATLGELTGGLAAAAGAGDLLSLGEASDLFAELAGVDVATLAESSQIEITGGVEILAQDFFALAETSMIEVSDGGLNIISGTGSPSGARLQGRDGAATMTRAGSPALTSRRIE